MVQDSPPHPEQLPPAAALGAQVGQESFPEAVGYTWAGGLGGWQAAAGEQGVRHGAEGAQREPPDRPPLTLQCSQRMGGPAGSPSAMAAACSTPARQRAARTGDGGSQAGRGPPAATASLPSSGSPRPLSTLETPLPSALPPQAQAPDPSGKEGMGVTGASYQQPAGHPARGRLWEASEPGPTCVLTPRCATTHNYDRDRAWGYCAQTSVPREDPGGCWRGVGGVGKGLCCGRRAVQAGVGGSLREY